MLILLLTLARAFHLGSAMFLVALLFFRLFTLSAAPGKQAHAIGFPGWFFPFFWSTLLVQVLSGLAWFWLVAEQMSGELPGWSDLAVVLGQTHFGRLWLVRSGLGVGLAGAALAAAWRPRRPRPNPVSLRSGLAWLALVCAALLLGSLAWAGHADSGRRLPRLHLVNDVLHLLVGATWPMGLVPLLVWLIRQPATESSADRADKIAVLNRFSRHSFIAVFVIVVSGAINGGLMLGAWAELVTTLYGQLLVAKIAVVGAMIALGAYHRYRSLPQLRAGADGWSDLYRTLGLETGLVLVVLGLVGIMGVTPPPH